MDSPIKGFNTSRRIFEAVGFTTEDNRLLPPLLDITTPEGRAARLKLLRVWVEIGAVIADYTSRYRMFFGALVTHEFLICPSSKVGSKSENLYTAQECP